MILVLYVLAIVLLIASNTKSNALAKKIVMVVLPKRYAALKLRTKTEYFVQMNLPLMAVQLNVTKLREKYPALPMKQHLAANQKQHVLPVQKALMGNFAQVIRFVKSSVNGMRFFALMATTLADAKISIYV